MSSEYTNSFPLKCVPNVASPVIITPKEDATRDRERNGSDAAEDVVVGKRVELTIGTNVEQTARSVIGSRGEGVAVGEESTVSVRCGRVN